MLFAKTFQISFQNQRNKNFTDIGLTELGFYLSKLTSLNLLNLEFRV